MKTLRQIVYVSTARPALREADMVDILQVSRACNSQNEITGLLLHAEGNFIQVIEGSHAALENLIRAIKRDPRHHRLLILLDRVTEERDFDGWHMGFQRITHRELDAIVGFHNWTGEMPARRKNTAAVRLIESFRSNAVARH